MISSHQFALDPAGTPLPELISKFADIAGTEDLGSRLVLAAAAIVHEVSNTQATVLDVERMIFCALEEPFPNIVRHPKSVLLRRILLDHSEVDDEEFEDALNFLGSHVAVKMQGEMAELLALHKVVELLDGWRRDGRLPPEARLIAGRDIRMAVEGRVGWFKGADGLIAVRSDGLDGMLSVCGVVEIKSYRPSWRRVRQQMRSHQSRLARGLRVGNEEWSADCLSFLLLDDQGWKRHPATDPPPDLPAILIVPRRSGKPSRSPPPGNLTGLFLDVPYGELTACGHALVVWVLEHMGRQLFTDPSLCPPGMEPEDAAINALQEALYYAPDRKMGNVAKKAAETFCRICYGSS